MDGGPRELTGLRADGPARRAVVVASLAAAAALFVASGVPVCPLAIVAHVPCPGCGLTRAGLALLHGDLHGAWHLHPLSFVAIPLLAALAGWSAWSYVRGGLAPAAPGPASPWVTWAAAAFGAALLAVWIARFFGAFGGPVPV